jgi:hypothetical protein
LHVVHLERAYYARMGVWGGGGAMGPQDAEGAVGAEVWPLLRVSQKPIWKKERASFPSVALLSVGIYCTVRLAFLLSSRTRSSS